MKKTSFPFKLILPILIIILILAFCQQPVSHQTKTISQSEMDSFHHRAVYEFPNFDNISQIIKLLKEIDVVYIPDAINDMDNLEKYSANELLMAANIGVYMTDIGYMWSYNESDAAFNYNIAVISLAEQLNMAMEFLESAYEKYGEQETNPDTILELIEQDLHNAIRQFPEEGRLRLYSAFLTGSFIEKLHLLYEMIKRCPEISDPVDLNRENFQKLVWIASGQIKALEELNKQIDSYAIPEAHKLYHEELIKLDSLMKQTDFLKDSVIISSVQLVEDPEFLNLYQEISKLRNGVINPEIITVR